MSGRAFPRSMQKPQTGLTSPTCRTPPGQNSGHPPDSSRADLLHPGFDATYLSYDTSTAIPETRTAHRLSDPHLTHPVRLFHIAHHDGLQPTQHVVVCSHPPHERLRRAKPSSPAQHHVKKLYLQTELLSTFVAHVGSQCPWRMTVLPSLGSLHVLRTVASDGIQRSCTSRTFGVMCTLGNTLVRLPGIGGRWR